MFSIKNDFTLKGTQMDKNQASKPWELSRRNFVKFILLSGVVSQIPLATSCIQQSDSDESLVSIVGIDFTPNLKTIQNVQEILFPSDNLGPGANENKSDIYLIWVLHDHRLDQEETHFIVDGFKQLEDLSEEQYRQGFSQLDQEEQHALIERLSVMDWGQDWLSKLLTLIFESLFANPHYGSNPEGIGWKWLNHQPGWPQPEEDQIYPIVLEKNQQKFKS